MTASNDGGPQPEPIPAPRPTTWLGVLFALRWPLTLLLVVVLGLVALQRTVRQAQRDAVESLGEAAATIAQRFSSGTITTTFIAALPQLAPDSGLKLELAAFEATEILSRSDDRRVLFDLLSLGTTVTEIRVPVTYRYHLRLDEPWQLDVRDHACLVQAPRIHPTLPPALHSDGIEKRVSSGWLRFDDAEQMATLERSLTPAFSARAGDPRHVELVREICRRRVAEFVRSWLLVENHWQSDRFSSVTVVFADENRDPALLGPTLELEIQPR
jgi:hypothetical protein